MWVQQGSTSGDEYSESSEDEPGDGEDEAEVRVRALLFNHLATKRTDVKIDMSVADAGDDDAPAVPSVGLLACKVIVFVEEQLGMVLAKGKKGEAVVASVVRGSPARQAGIVQGDVVVGVNASRTSDFNQVLWLLRQAERPMHLLLLE